MDTVQPNTPGAAAPYMTVTPFTLAVRPGVSTQSTALQTGAGLNDSNLIRHKMGQVQKLGGCTRLSNSVFIGTARGLLPWEDLSNNRYVAIATTELLQLYYEGLIYPIHPVESTSDLATPFTTTASSTTVTITDGGFVPTVGQWINIRTLCYVDGITLQGLYQVTSVGVGDYEIEVSTPASAGVVGGGDVLTFDTTNTFATVDISLGAATFQDGEVIIVGTSTSVGGLTVSGAYAVAVTAGPVYTITDDESATSTASAQENGGNVQIEYLLLLSTSDGTTGLYGMGLYGAGYYGVATPGGEALPVYWTLALWGENLIAAYSGGTLYEWVPPVALGNVATPVSGAPSEMNGVFVAAPQQQAIAWGIYSVTLAEQDDLLLGWCDVSDLNDWTASATNQAGTFRLSSGSRIMAGQWFGVVGLVWTDLDVWSMTYVGFPYIYGFNRVAENCGLISPRAMGTLASQVFWMSQDEFFVYSGGAVATLPCAVHDFVFDDLDRNNLQAVYCAVNSSMSEVTWWFPIVGGDGVCTRYAKYNVAEQLWDIGADLLRLSAWADQSVVGQPIGADYNNLLQQFETSVDFDGERLTSSFLTGYWRLSEGQEYVTIKRILPDFTLSDEGVVQITVYVADTLAPVPGAAYPVRQYGPYEVTNETPYIIVRARGRVMQLLVESQALNTFWRYGSPIAEIQRDGSR